MAEWIVEAETLEELENGFYAIGAELVRCKECKWYEPDLYNNSFGVCCHEEWVIAKCGSGVDADGFCYRGERREDGC